MRQPNFSQLYFRCIRHTSIFSSVAGIKGDKSEKEREREREREREKETERDRQTTIVVANLHVFHIRGRPFSSDLDAERYVVKHMAFNARGIAHRSEERDPLIFGNHANHAFFSSGRVNRHPPHWHSIRAMGLFLERCT